MQQSNSLVKTSIQYPTRPNFNINFEEKDRPIKVICNLREITFNTSDIILRQYSIYFKPRIAQDNYPLKKKIIRILDSDLKKYFEKYILSGDTLFAAGKDLPEKAELDIKVDDNDTFYKVEFVKTKNVIDFRNIHSITKDDLKIKHAVELIIKKIIYSNNDIFRIHNAFYNYKDCEFLGKDRSAIINHGYTTAVCITGNGLFFRLNDKYKIITGKTAYDKMVDLHKNYKANICYERFISLIQDYFIGKTVIALYGGNRIYHIGDVLFDRDINNTSYNVTNSKGIIESMSLKQYYKMEYGIKIKYENQPLFIDEDSMENETARKNYIVPELVYLTGIDEFEERDKFDIIAKSKFHPSIKLKKIEKGMSYLTNTEKKIVLNKNKKEEYPSPNDIRKEWNINFAENFLQVDGRVLPLPEFQFGCGMSEKPKIINNKFRLKRDKLGVNFDDNNCFVLTFNHLVNSAKIHYKKLFDANSGNALSVSFKFPQILKLNSSNKDDILKEFNKFKIDENKKIVLVVLDHKTKHLYPFIKNFLFTEKGIPSQFILHDGIVNKSRKKLQNASYYNSVFNQMVVKTKGELFSMRFCKGIDLVPSMIIGIDSFKLSGEKGDKYAVSASYNRQFNKFYTEVGIATDAKDDRTLVKLLSNCVYKFIEKNQMPPKNVIIYRKGGNEKQTEKKIIEELPKIVDFFNGKESDLFYKVEKPKLTVFSVNKKTDLKFFQPVKIVYENIPMGSVIDKDVTSPDLFEFYLQCPDVKFGCASPAHFLCIYNNNESMTFNDYVDISFKQSFYYWNWPGPISIPAALKYAEVANSFSSKYLTHEVKDELKDSPYYI